MGHRKSIDSRVFFASLLLFVELEAVDSFFTLFLLHGATRRCYVICSNWCLF
jgi:hypothetical protein